MDNDSSYVAPFRISTEDLPERDRLAIWTEVACRTLLKLEFEPVTGVRFYHTLTLRKLPGLSMALGKACGCRTRLAPQHIANGEGGFSFYFNRTGAIQTSQSGQETMLAPGEAVLLSNEHPGSTLQPGINSGMLLNIPADALVNRGADPFASTMRTIPKTSEVLRLLTDYVSLFDAVNAQSAPESKLAGTTFVSHVYDLLALMLQPGRESWDRAKGGLRAARLHAIKTGILARLAQGDLSVNAVAAREGVSPRYVQKLFEEEGTSFTAFLLNERLARVHRLLSDARFAGRTIAAIVYEAGFTDLSNFNRFFRRRYGVTPSDVRAAAKHSLS
jgi:AraC-like DNA-binding protein